MEHLVILRSKTVIEIITFSADFTKDLDSGDSISSATSGISVFSGTDSNPSSMLLDSVTIHGDVCGQRIKEGIPGNVYQVVISATTAKGLVLHKVARLAVLPTDGTAQLFVIDHYFTSTLYPQYFGDSFQGSLVSVSGLLLEQPSQLESFTGALVSISGTLTTSSVSYNIPYDAFTGSFVSISGNLTLGRVSYDAGYDSFTGSFVSLSGTLTEGRVRYTTPHDSFIGSLVSLSGTLS